MSQLEMAGLLGGRLARPCGGCQESRVVSTLTGTTFVQEDAETARIKR